MHRDAEALRHAVHSFIRRFGLLEQAQTPCGMPLPLSQAHALMELLRAPEITQQDLADRLALSKSNISRLVGRLVATGRAHRQKDGRACRVVLTAKGRRLATDLDGRSLDRFRTLLGNLPERQHSAVVRALSLLADTARDAGETTHDSPALMSPCCRSGRRGWLQARAVGAGESKAGDLGSARRAPCSRAAA